MDLITNDSSREARELKSIWQLRIVPATMIGSFIGAALGSLPSTVAFYMYFLPLFAWVYWRLIRWKNWPETRLVTVAVPLAAAMVEVAVLIQG
jgi:hypothetical protein